MERSLPFSVSRSSRHSLAAQVADGLRECIASGFYKAGETLPPTRELAEMLGVSRIVTRAALHALAEEGLVNPRPGVGGIVLGSGERRWNGRVMVIVSTDGRTYYVNVFTATLRAMLVKAGWLFTQTTVEFGNGTNADTSELEVQLAHKVDLAIIVFDNKAAERALTAAGVPYVVLGQGTLAKSASRLAQVRYDRGAASEEVARVCAEAGVKSCLQIGPEAVAGDMAPALVKAGIAFSSMTIKTKADGLMPETVAFAARDAFARRLADCRFKLPDLLYFSDDHACTGALIAMLEAGVRIPGDVKVLTWANRGNGPVFSKPLSRIEFDPEAHAKLFAKGVLHYLDTGETPTFASFTPRFVRGETL